MIYAVVAAESSDRKSCGLNQPKKPSSKRTQIVRAVSGFLVEIAANVDSSTNWRIAVSRLSQFVKGAGALPFKTKLSFIFMTFNTESRPSILHSAVCEGRSRGCNGMYLLGFGPRGIG